MKFTNAKIYSLFIVIAVLIALLFANVFNLPSTIGSPGTQTTEADYIVFKSGSTFYVKDGMNGSESSHTNAAIAIQNAINNLTSGGLIHIKRGAYWITCPINITNNGVTIQGEGESTILQTSTATRTITFRIMQKQDITIRDLNIDGRKTFQPDKGNPDQNLILVYD